MTQLDASSAAHEIRTLEISRGLQNARERIDQACRLNGRGNVDLIVVTKTYPASDVKILNELGICQVAENRDQEAKTKAVDCGPNVTWHMIGQIQSKKANSIARWAQVVETCDRLELVSHLARAAHNADKVLKTFVQINLDPMSTLGTGRGGAHPDEFMAVARAVVAHESLELRGVMAVAPHPDLGIDPAQAFTALKGYSERLAAEFPWAVEISAGMSSDLEAAIAHGATQVRIGSAILGERPAVQ